MSKSSLSLRPRVASLVLSACMLVGSLAQGCSTDDKGKRVLAVVGDHEVTAQEFEGYLRFKRIVVRSDKDADLQLKAYAERLAAADAASQSKLLDQNELQVELEEFRKEMLTSRYFEAYLRTAVTRDRVEQYYKDHLGEYQDKRVHVAHILVRATRSASDEERAAAKAKIESAIAELKGGKDFAAVAQAVSDDRVTGNRGGDMGLIREGAIDPRFSAAAFALGEGQVSDPVETAFGYHLIKVLEAPQVHTQPLSAVESDIRYKLRTEAKDRETARLDKSTKVVLKRAGWLPEQTSKTQEASAQAESHK